MPNVNLKRLIKKGKDTHEIFMDILNLFPSRIGVFDDKGSLLIGVPIENPTKKIPIKLEEDIIGWVFGNEHAKVFAKLLQQYAVKENERKTLGQEVLTVYREINVIYDFSEKLAKTIDPKEIAKLALEEANHLIMATGGVIILVKPGMDKKTEMVSTSGKEFIKKIDIQNTRCFFGKIENIDNAEIINDTKSDDRFDTLPPEVTSLIYAPLKVKQRILGLIVM